MTSEMRELIAQAKNGDKAAADAILNKGIDCHRNGDVDGAIRWWEAAAVELDVMGGGWNLAYQVYGNPNFGKADAKMFMKWLKWLAEGDGTVGWKNPHSMVLLGAIYCQSAGNEYIEMFPELVSAYNPKAGFALLEDAVKRAENTSKNPQNPLGMDHYSSIRSAYHADTTKRNKDPSNMFFKGFGHLAALAKKSIYDDRALDAAKAGRGTKNRPQEVMQQLIALNEMLLHDSKKELLSMLQAYLSRAQLSGQSYENEMMREIGELRSTGEVDGISVAGKDELADVLEKFLQVALDEIA